MPSSEVAEEPTDQGDHQDTGQHRLWVDAFAPKRYTELLSDDVSPALSIPVLETLPTPEALPYWEACHSEAPPLGGSPAHSGGSSSYWKPCPSVRPRPL